MMNMNPILEVTSRIAGRNAKVQLFPDRIEWTREGLMSSGAKVALGVATAGLSLAATGVGRKRDTEMIPVRAVSHVSTRKDGLRFTVVTLATAGGDVELRCSHGDAKVFVDAVRHVMLAA